MKRFVGYLALILLPVSMIFNAPSAANSNRKSCTAGDQSRETVGLRFVGRFVSVDDKAMTVTFKLANGQTQNWPITESSIARVRQLKRGDLISLVYSPEKPIPLNEIPRTPTVSVSLTRDAGCTCHQFDSTGHCMGTCSGTCPKEFPYCVLYSGFTTSRACVCSKTP
jgi:hypothetical protein